MRPLRTLLAISFLAGAFARQACADPIDYSEVSLLVRARESEASIIQEVSRRKLVRPLTPQQENTLRTQGAGESLIRALKGPAVALSAPEATAYETRRAQLRTEPKPEARTSSRSKTGEMADDLHVFEVSVGHRINLSQWGGPHYEFAFLSPTRLDEGREDAVLIDTIRSGTDVATYLGAGRPDDSTTIFDRRNYVSVINYSFTRGLRIDRRNPVWVKGSPYTLYPVYAAGGVSLYYISGTSDSVKLAVSTARSL